MPQLSLLKPKPFEPMRLRAEHYVAALQNRSGELAALANASEDTWRRFTPLVQIVGPKDSAGPLNASTVAAWVKRIADAVDGHPLFLDVMRLKPSHPVTTTNGTVAVLERIYWAARRRGLVFVPTIWVGRSDPTHLAMAANAHAVDGRGVAFRYTPRSLILPPNINIGAYLMQLRERLDVEPESADLLIDLEFIESDAELHPEDVADAINDAVTGGAWRNVVLLGTSIPSMLGCVPEGSVGELPRREWELWLDLREALGDVNVSFGDYAIQHCRPPEDGGGPSMRANIRYTTSGVTLIARGTGAVIVEGIEQYRELCDWLTARPEFCGRGYSWGDRTIYDCSRGTLEPGAQSMWRGAGTSHHLRFVTDQLRARAAAA